MKELASELDGYEIMAMTSPQAGSYILGVTSFDLWPGNSILSKSESTEEKKEKGSTPGNERQNCLRWLREHSVTAKKCKRTPLRFFLGGLTVAPQVSNVSPHKETMDVVSVVIQEQDTDIPGWASGLSDFN